MNTQQTIVTIDQALELANRIMNLAESARSADQQHVDISGLDALWAAYQASDDALSRAIDEAE